MQHVLRCLSLVALCLLALPAQEHSIPGYQLSWYSDSNFNTLESVRHTTTMNFTDGNQRHFNRRTNTDVFSLRYRAQLQTPVAGSYQFTFGAIDDIAHLYINDQQVLTKELGNKQKDSITIDLQSGMNELRVDYINTGGSAKLELLWQGPGIKQSNLEAFATV